MKLNLTLSLSFTTLLLTTAATALPSHFSSIRRDCTPADGVATDGNMFWADNCDLGAGEDGWGQKMVKRVANSLSSLSFFEKRNGGPPGPGHWDGHHDNGQQSQQQQNNGNGNGGDGHDANWNGVYEQTPGCTPGADGVATDGNQFWADNCDLGAGGP